MNDVEDTFTNIRIQVKGGYRRFKVARWSNEPVGIASVKSQPHNSPRAVKSQRLSKIGVLRFMVTLVDREFTVNVSRERAWNYLARLDLWPTWAPHIKHIATHPQGDLGPNSSGVIHLANGVKSEFQMTEFNPYHNWKWVGPFLWLTIHYDHRFESVSSDQTRLRFVLDASGFGVGFFGRLFATIYRRNLEKAIPLLVKAMELA